MDLSRSCHTLFADGPAQSLYDGYAFLSNFYQGNEGVEVKEGSVDNIIEGNKIYTQRDPNSGGMLACVWR